MQPYFNQTRKNMEDNLNIFENGRRPQYFENGRRPQFFSPKTIDDLTCSDTIFLF